MIANPWTCQTQRPCRSIDGLVGFLWLLVGCVTIVVTLGCDPNRASSGGASPPQKTQTSPLAPSPKESAKGAGEDSKGTSGSFEKRVLQANELLEDNKVDEAWKIARDLMIEKPESTESLFIASRVLAMKRDLRGAIQLISRIDENDSMAGPAATGQLAEWLAESGDLMRAEAKLLRLLKKFPNGVPAIRLLIDIYSAQGRRWESAKYLERLVRLGNFTEEELYKGVDFREPYDNERLRAAAMATAPNEPYSQLAEIRYRALKNRWDEIAEPLQRFVAMRPELLEPWIWYGETLLELGHRQQFSLWISKRPEGFDKHPEYWYVYGMFLREQRRTREAARCFAESIQLDRRHAAAYQALGACLLDMGLTEDAQRIRKYAGDLTMINDMAQQIQRKHADRDAYQRIANLYESVGDTMGAFAWRAMDLSRSKKPITDSLKQVQAELKRGEGATPSMVATLPFQEWPLPVDDAFDRVPAITLDTHRMGDDRSILMDDVAASRQLMARYDLGGGTSRGMFTYEGNGGGVSVIDYDRDGWPDLFHSQAGDKPLIPNANYQPKTLHRSRAGASFSEVAALAQVADRGYGQGTATADIDQDGFSDLLVANIGSIEYYRNQGDGTFEHVPLPQAPPPSYWNSCIQAADINGDSLPDIVQGMYSDGTEVFERLCPHVNSTSHSCHPKSFAPGKPRILFNQGDGTWKLADQELLDSIRFGYNLGVLITNIDQRAGNDVFIANDVSPNHLLLSQNVANNPIVLYECAASAGVAVDSVGRAQACMGIACGDQNRDGLLDIIVTNYRNEVSTLYLQTAPGVFADGSRRSNLGPLTLEWLSFGCQLADLDNDGWLDFVALNGHIDDLRQEGAPWQMPPQVLKNEQGKFRWLKKPSPGKYFDGEWVGRGLSMLDYNRDGRVDMVATHIDRPTALLENQSPTGNHFVQIEAIGTRCERDAIGAIVRISAGGEKWVAPVAVGEGFFGSNEHLIHVGIGSASRLDAIEIDWPGGGTERFTDLAVDTRYLVLEGLGVSPIALREP